MSHLHRCIFAFYQIVYWISTFCFLLFSFQTIQTLLVFLHMKNQPISINFNLQNYPKTKIIKLKTKKEITIQNKYVIKLYHQTKNRLLNFTVNRVSLRICALRIWLESTCLRHPSTAFALASKHIHAHINVRRRRRQQQRADDDVKLRIYKAHGTHIHLES